MRHITLMAITGANKLQPTHLDKSVQLFRRSGTHRFHLQIPNFQVSYSDLTKWEGARILVPDMTTRWNAPLKNTYTISHILVINPYTGVTVTRQMSKSYTHHWFNSLTIGASDCHIKNITLKYLFMTNVKNTSVANICKCVSEDLDDGKSSLVGIMAWYHQATSHYLNQCWTWYLVPLGHNELKRMSFNAASKLSWTHKKTTKMWKKHLFPGDQT